VEKPIERLIGSSTKESATMSDDIFHFRETVDYFPFVCVTSHCFWIVPRYLARFSPAGEFAEDPQCCRKAKLVKHSVGDFCPSLLVVDDLSCFCIIERKIMKVFLLTRLHIADNEGFSPGGHPGVFVPRVNRDVFADFPT
jgi:hypothetical protein